MVVQCRLFHVLWPELNAIALVVTLLLLLGAAVKYSCKADLSVSSWPNERLWRSPGAKHLQTGSTMMGLAVTKQGQNSRCSPGIRREQIGVGKSVQPWGLPGTNTWLGRTEQRTIALQTGNLHGTVPLYLGETDFGGIVQPVYTVSICMSVDVVDVPQVKRGHPLPSNKYTHVFINFGSTFFKNPAAALREAFRVLKPGGLLGFTVWAKVGLWIDMKSAVASVEGTPPFPSDEQTLRAHTDDPGYVDIPTVRNTIHGMALDHTEVTQKDGQSELQDIAEFKLMEGAMYDLFTRTWKDEQRNRFRDGIASAIESFMKQKYGSGPII